MTGYSRDVTSPYRKKKIGSPVHISGTDSKGLHVPTYLQVEYSGEGDKTPHGNRMVIDLFRELDEHPVEVAPNPSSPAFFAVLSTVLKRAYSLVSIRRRSDDFSTLQRGGTHVRLVSTQSG